MAFRLLYTLWLTLSSSHVLAQVPFLSSVSAAITSVATMNPQEISQTGAHPVIPHPQTNSLTSPGLCTHQVQAPSVTQLSLILFTHQVQAPTVTQWPQTPEQSKGMILLLALQLEPAHLVRQIRAGEFIKMRDFLTDNVR